MPTKVSFVLTLALALAAAIPAMADQKDEQTKTLAIQQTITCQKASTSCDRVPKGYVEGRSTTASPSAPIKGGRTNKLRGRKQSPPGVNRRAWVVFLSAARSDV